MTKTITKINGVDLVTVEQDGCIYIPVKPVCQAIGVDFEGQRQRILRHYILGSTAFTLKAVGADNKDREMLCIPLEYVYGWIFTIDANLVAEENRGKVMQYQAECYRALYEHFISSMRRTIETNNAEIKLLRRINYAIAEEREVRTLRKKDEESLDRLRAGRPGPCPSIFE